MLKSFFLLTLILLVCSSAPINMKLYKHVFTPSGIKQIDCLGRDCELIENIECNSYGNDQHGVPMWQCKVSNRYQLDNPEMLCSCKDALASCCGLKFKLQDVTNMQDVMIKFNTLALRDKVTALFIIP